MIRRTEDWQNRVLGLVDAVPEVGHAGLFVSNTTSKVFLKVEGDDGNAAAIERQLKDFPMGRVCSNIFYVGEVIVAYKYDGGRTRWSCYGKKDYKVEEKKPLKVKGEDGKFRELGPEWKWFRIWRPDVSDRLQAWSSHKSQLDLLEAMYVHQLADTAVATSRLAGAGILYIPNDEMTDTPVLDGGHPEPGSQAHFEERLRGAMTDSISNRKVEDAFVPLVMFGSSEFADGIRHALMERVDNPQGFAERMEGYARRYGRTTDLPVEVVMGMGETTNHWGAWKVDQNTWNYCLEPLVQVSVDALMQEFVTPVALALGSRADLTIRVDATKVITKPDKTDAAIRAYAAGALSGEGLLHYAGFDEAFIHPHANDPSTGTKTQPDGQVRMPSASFRGSEGQPVGDRNFQR